MAELHYWAWEISRYRTIFPKKGETQKKGAHWVIRGPHLPPDLKILFSGLRPQLASKKRTRVEERGPASWHLLIDHLSKLISPSFFSSAGHVKCLQVSAGTAVPGNQRCSHVEGWLGKWIRASWEAHLFCPYVKALAPVFGRSWYNAASVQWGRGE